MTNINEFNVSFKVIDLELRRVSTGIVLEVKTQWSCFDKPIITTEKFETLDELVELMDKLEKMKNGQLNMTTEDYKLNRISM